MNIKSLVAAAGAAGFLAASFSPLSAAGLAGSTSETDGETGSAVRPVLFATDNVANKPLLAMLSNRVDDKNDTSADAVADAMPIDKNEKPDVRPAEATPQAEPAKPIDTVAVQPGDSLSTIAAAKQTTYIRLFNANPEIAQPDVILPGSVIRIPTPEEQLPERPLPAPPAPKVAVASVAAPVRKQPVATAAAPVPADASVWDRLAQCESGGNWAINTGNNYYGGLQFTLGTWRGVGGTGYPHQASREEQIARAQMLQARRGWSPWPACTAKLGLR